MNEDEQRGAAGSSRKKVQSFVRIFPPLQILSASEHLLRIPASSIPLRQERFDRGHAGAGGIFLFNSHQRPFAPSLILLPHLCLTMRTPILHLVSVGNRQENPRRRLSVDFPSFAVRMCVRKGTQIVRISWLSIARIQDVS